MRNWYSIKALASDAAEIAIYDEIGMWGITAKDFIADLKKIDATKLNLSINSPGGSVFDGFAIFNALKASGKDITVTVVGIAASMASVIAMAGKKIKMPKNAMMMVHNAISGVYGDAENMREVADVLDKIDNSIVATYVARTGKSEEEVRALMADDTYMTAEEAVSIGFADELIDEMKVTACFELERLPENVKAMFQSAQNTILNPKSIEGMDCENADVALSADGMVLVVSNDDGITTYDWVVVNGAGSWVARPFMLETEDEESEAPMTPQNPYAQQVETLAAEAGMPEFAAIWGLRSEKIEDVKALIANAREITALCALVKRPEDARGYIQAGKTVSDVRNALCAKLAEQDERTHTDTTPRNHSTPPVTAQPGAIKTADIWAARRKSFK